MSIDQSEPRAIGANDRDLEAGQQVGEYVIESRLGQGGFGTVFKATHPLIGKVVAIKVLNRQYSAQPEMVSRFVAEARAVNQIRNRFIIDIFGFGQLEDGRHYYVMEYLDGAPLDDYLERHGRLLLADAIPILRAVARALDAAHAKGIAHRDLKPENVFLVAESDGTLYPKLLDFGIAKLLVADDQLKHKTRTGAPIGTPYYMSPEQCRGRDVDHRTDVYAFGCVTYKLLTGVVPFDGEDYMEILIKQMNDAVPPASALVPDLPPSVDAVIAWMMAKDPAQRPASVVAAVRGLEDAAVAAGVVLPPITAPLGSMSVAARTPSGLLPIGRASGPAPGMTPADVAGAATLDAQSLTGPGAAAASAGRTAPPNAPVAAPRRRVWTFVAATVVPLAALIVTFVVVRGKKDATETAAPAAGIVDNRNAAGTDPGTPATPDGLKQTPAQTPAPTPTPATVAIMLTGVPAGTAVLDPEGHVLTTATGGDTVIMLPTGSSEVKIALHHPELGDGYMTVTPAAPVKLAATALARPTIATPANDPRKTGKTGKKAGGKTRRDGKANTNAEADRDNDKGSKSVGDKPPGGADSNAIEKPAF